MYLFSVTASCWVTCSPIRQGTLVFSSLLGLANQLCAVWYLCGPHPASGHLLLEPHRMAHHPVPCRPRPGRQPSLSHSQLLPPASQERPRCPCPCRSHWHPWAPAYTLGPGRRGTALTLPVAHWGAALWPPLPAQLRLDLQAAEERVPRPQGVMKSRTSFCPPGHTEALVLGAGSSGRRAGRAKGTQSLGTDPPA